MVTGAASGIGLALAARFAREPMTVVLTDLPGDRLDTAVRALAGGADVRGAALDVADAGASEAVARSTEEALGAIDLVCLNAGVLGPTNIPLWEIDRRDWQ